MDESSEQLSGVFAALGDATRLHLVHRLQAGQPQSIAQLSQGLSLSHQGVTKHLRVLENAGLVGAQKVGREKRYWGNAKQIGAARSYLDQVAAQWDVALLRLKQHVEKD